jgi:hypothetical protein
MQPDLQGYVTAALGRPTAREVAEQLLLGAADLQAGSSNPATPVTNLIEVRVVQLRHCR